MQMVFHLGVHCTDGDRLLKTLLNNRDTLLHHQIEVVPPSRHRGLFEEALMALNGGAATVEMEQIMLDAVLVSDAPQRVVFSTPTFMGAPGRVCGRNQGLYPQIGTRAAALANLFPSADSEFFLAIRNPATLLTEVLKVFTGGDYDVLLQGNSPLRLRWREAIQRLIRAMPGRRIVIWCHEDVPLIWPEILRLAGALPPGAPLTGGFSYIQELVSPEGFTELQAILAEQDQLSVMRRRELEAQALKNYARPGALEQDIDLPGWTQELVDQVTDLYHADIAEIAVLPGVEFVLP